MAHASRALSFFRPNQQVSCLLALHQVIVLIGEDKCSGKNHFTIQLRAK